MTLEEADRLMEGSAPTLGKDEIRGGISPTEADRLMAEPTGYRRAIAPVTQGVQKWLADTGERAMLPYDAGMSALRRLGIVGQDTAPAIGLGARGGGMPAATAAARGPAEAIVPQTPVQAGTMAGSLLLGGPIGAGFRAAAPGVAPVAGPILSRILGGTLGGATGGAMSDEGAMTGALKGGGATAAGEGLGKGLGWLAGIMPGGKRALNRVDSERIGGAVEEISPPLGGARVPTDFQRLVEQRGLPALGAAKEQVTQRVEGMLPGQTGGAWNQQMPPGQIPMPAMGTRTRPFDSARPPGVGLRDVNDEISAVGDMLHNRRPLDPRYRDVDLKQKYGDLVGERAAGLEAAGGSVARETFEGGQRAYQQGRGVYDFLRDVGGLDANGMLNVPKMQRMLMNPETAAALQKDLGPVAFKRFSDAIFRGAERAGVDRMTPGSGGLLDALGSLRTNRGASQAFMVPFGTAFPNALSQYVGKRPQLALPPPLQQIIDAASARALP